MRNGKYLVVLLWGVLALYGQTTLDVTIDTIGDSSTISQFVKGFTGDYEKGYISPQKLAAAESYLQNAHVIDSLNLDTTGAAPHLFVKKAYVIRDINIYDEFPLMEGDLLKALTIHSGSFYDHNTVDLQSYYFLSKLAKHGYLVNDNTPPLPNDIDNSSDRGNGVEIEDSAASEEIGAQPSAIINDTTDTTYSSLTVVVDSFVQEGVVDISFYVHLSSHVKVELLAFEGNEKFTNFWNGLIFGGWRYRVGKSAVRSRFVEEDVPDDIKKLRDHYYKRDFAEIEVRDSLVIDTAAKRAYVTLLIDEGPQYKIIPKDLYPLRRGMVRRVLDFRDRGNSNDYMLRRKIEELETLYQSRGYVSAEVSWSDTLKEKRQYSQRRITVSVDTGAREQVSAITLEGNEALSDKKLRKQMKTMAQRKMRRSGKGSFIEEVFANDIQRIENLYYNQGYLSVKVAGSSKGAVEPGMREVSIAIEEGSLSLFDTLIYTGLTEDSLLEVLRENQELTAGDPYSPQLFRDDLIMIKSTIADNGYLNDLVDFTHHFTEEKGVSIEISVDLGKKTTAGDVLYTGNFKSNADHLTKIVRVDHGDPLSLTKLYRGIRRLRDIDVLTSVTYAIPTLRDSLYDTSAILLSLEEAKPFVLTGRVGFDSYERFNTKLSISNRNFLGKSKVLTLSGWYSAVEYGVDVTYLEPYLLYTDLKLGVRLYTIMEELLDEKRVNTLTFGNSYQFSYDIVRDIAIAGIKTSYEVKEMREGSRYDPNDPALDSSGINRNYFDIFRHIIALETGLTLDYRNSFMQPTKGIYNYFGNTISKGITLDEDNYVQFENDFRFYIPLGRKMVLASRMGAKVLHGYGDTKEVVSDQLLTIGGVQDVRGYAEEKLFPTGSDKSAAPTFAYGTLYGSVELRIEIIPSIELTNFIDVGTLTANSDLSQLRLPRFSVGAGLLYVTPIGPIGLLYGYRIYTQKDAYPKEGGHGRLHFSIGYTF